MTLEAAREMDRRCVINWLIEVLQDPAVAFNTHSEEQLSEFAHDALVLLKEQEPRVMTLDEIKDGESYWFQRCRMLVTRPVICIHREDDVRKPYITFAWQFGTFSWDSEDYGKVWRCWSAKPTDEQRDAVKWEDEVSNGSREGEWCANLRADMHRMPIDYSL